jgi:hypothetical protein
MIYVLANSQNKLAIQYTLVISTSSSVILVKTGYTAINPLNGYLSYVNF